MPVSIVTNAYRAGRDAHRDYRSSDGPSPLARSMKNRGMYNVVYDMVTLANKGVDRLRDNGAEIASSQRWRDESGSSSGGHSGFGPLVTGERKRVPALSVTTALPPPPAWAGTSPSSITSSTLSSPSSTHLSMPPPPGSSGYAYHHLPMQVYLDVPPLPERPERSPRRTSNRNARATRTDNGVSSGNADDEHLNRITSAGQERANRRRTRVTRFREMLSDDRRERRPPGSAPAYEDDSGIVMPAMEEVELFEDQIDPPPPYPGPPASSA